MFKHFRKSAIESILTDLSEINDHHKEQQAWSASFKDGQDRAKGHEEAAQLISGFIKLLEQELLERELLKVTDVQTSPPSA